MLVSDVGLGGFTLHSLFSQTSDSVFSADDGRVLMELEYGDFSLVTEF